MKLLSWPVYLALLAATLVLPWRIPRLSAQNRAIIASLLFMVASVFMPGQNGEILMATLPGLVIVMPIVWAAYAIFDRRTGRIHVPPADDTPGWAKQSRARAWDGQKRLSRTLGRLPRTR